MGGYPGVDGDNNGVSAVHATRTPFGYLGGLAQGMTPVVVTLGPGQAASALFEGLDGTATGHACPTYITLVVTPPGETTSVTVASPATLCSPQIHPVVPGTTGTSSEPTASPTTATPLVSRCHTSELQAAVNATNAAAGSDGDVLTLTNTAGTTCTVDGYVSLQLVDATRHYVPTDVVRDSFMIFTDHGPTPITLAPEQSAYAGVGYRGNPTEEDPPTGCPTSTYLEVTPPDETDYLFIPGHIGAGEKGRLTVTALQTTRPGLT